MSEKKPVNEDTPSDDSVEDLGPGEETSESDVKSEKDKLNAMGLENLSKASFGQLMMHNKPPEKKSDKKPFTF